jgi:hypothetical protein
MWLGRWLLVQTFDDKDDQEIGHNIKEIRELLDEPVIKGAAEPGYFSF